jgi:VCBS repeat-containing protein
VDIDPITGIITYTPDTDYTGPDSFTYTVNDDGGLISNEATVDIAVNLVNAAPTPVDDAETTDEDTKLTTIIVLDDDTDPDGDSLTISGFDDSTTIGTVTDNGDGTFAYDPNGQFENLSTGASAIDSFTYTVDDGKGGTATATVSITVNGINDAPAANDDPVSIDTDVNPSVDINVIANDSDVDSSLDPATVVATDPISGQVSVDSITGLVTYTPDPGFNGQDSFTYTVKDDLGLTSNEATVTVTVSANQPPDAKDDDITTTKGKDPVIILVLEDNGHGPDKDDDGDPLTVISFTQGERGEVTSNNDGTLTYTPTSNFKGTDSFEYTISDGKGGTDTATVFITTTN